MSAFLKRIGWLGIWLCKEIKVGGGRVRGRGGDGAWSAGMLTKEIVSKNAKEEAKEKIFNYELLELLGSSI